MREDSVVAARQKSLSPGVACMAVLASGKQGRQAEAGCSRTASSGLFCTRFRRLLMMRLENSLAT